MSIRVRVPGKVVWLGEHYVHRHGAVAAAIDRHLVLTTTPTDASLDALLVDALAARLGVAHPPRVFVEVSAIPPGVGLGSSSALVVGVVALLRAHAGLPWDRRAIFEAARAHERATSGASGVDAAACTFGGTLYYHPRTTALCPLGHFPDHCYLTPSGAPHAASCAEPLAGGDDAGVAALLARARRPRAQPLDLAELTAMLRYNHALLQANGLSTPRLDALCAEVGGKVTGRGRGGCALSATAGAWRVGVDEVGVCLLEDGLHAAPTVPRPVADALAVRRTTASAVAHPNIALVKYWGKVPHQMPANKSLSLVLPHFTTTTTVTLDADAPGELACTHSDPRVRAFVTAMLGDLVPRGTVTVDTVNSFPSKCGVASSASGFAALATALARLLVEDDAHLATDARLRRWTQQWARLGSGSAVRSCLASTALVSWQGANPVEHHHVHPSLRDLRHLLVVFDPLPKATSSADGHFLAPNCAFHPLRVAAADGHVDRLVAAFAAGDFATVRDLSEAEALTMHLVMDGSGLRYMNSESIAFATAFVGFRDERALEAFYTVDAGSNVHLLCAPAALDAVRGFVHARKHMFVLHEGVAEHRYARCLVLSGKRYSGKSTLAAACAAQHPVQLVTLSAALKADYWRTQGLPKDASRATTEAHRARMIAHGEAKRRADPYHWCRLAWAEGVRAAPRTLLVTDARRPEDLAFFRACCGACTHVRLAPSDAERARRGWVYDPAVDDDRSETGLDAAECDRVLRTADEADAFAAALA
jgi:diphosphomevalonate decarboxylase